MPATLKRLFASKLRVKVLDHFFSHPGEESYVRQLASALEEPVGTVARELSHLEEACILSSRWVGNQKHYRLREDCPILEDLGNIFLKTSGAGAELRRALEGLSGVELAFVYGSYASGKAQAASDLDLMIVGNASDRDLAPAVARVERRLKREINYTLYSREEAEKRIGTIGDFVHEAFSGPRILLIGSADDGLFRLAR
ncbi:MAG: nucleotidyltransferase domain-containing protein [Nitrospinota bacterium]